LYLKGGICTVGTKAGDENGSQEGSATKGRTFDKNHAFSNFHPKDARTREVSREQRCYPQPVSEGKGFPSVWGQAVSDWFQTCCKPLVMFFPVSSARRLCAGGRAMQNQKEKENQKEQKMKNEREKNEKEQEKEMERDK